MTWSWTVTAGCRNSSMAGQIIYILDTKAPVFASLPGPSTNECPNGPVFAQASATDDCGSGVTLTSVDATNHLCAASYIVTRTWTATDGCGNSSSASQIIYILDTKAPVLSGCPSSVTIECGDPVPAPANVTANDACEGPLTPVPSESSAPGANCAMDHIVKVITRTWNVVDHCGNSASCSQTITVVDTTPPSLVGVPSDTTVSCSGIIPTPPSVTATDACD